MMQWLAILTAFASANGAPLSETEGSKTVQAQYEQGSYKDFLHDLDTAYQEARNSAQFEQFLLMRDGVLPATSVIAPLSDEEAAKNQIASYRFMQPGTGNNSDENKLIDLDVEYEFKRIHLDSYAAVNGTSLEERQQQQTVLLMEWHDKMLKTSESFQDEGLKETVVRAIHQ
jgi:hypothetical protein